MTFWWWSLFFSSWLGWWLRALFSSFIILLLLFRGFPLSFSLALSFVHFGDCWVVFPLTIVFRCCYLLLYHYEIEYSITRSCASLLDCRHRGGASRPPPSRTPSTPRGRYYSGGATREERRPLQVPIRCRVGCCHLRFAEWRLGYESGSVMYCGQLLPLCVSFRSNVYAMGPQGYFVLLPDVDGRLSFPCF